MRLAEIYAEAAPYLPPAFGALIGLRWAKDQSPKQKVFSWLTGFGLAVWFAPGVCEFLSLGPKSTIAVGILVAIIGMDIVGGFLAAGAQFRSDPAGAFAEWLGAVRGRRDIPIPPTLAPGEHLPRSQTPKEQGGDK